MGWNHYTGPDTPSFGSGAAAAVSTVQQVLGNLQNQLASFTDQTSTILSELATVEVPSAGPMPDIVITDRSQPLEWPEPKPIDIDLDDVTAAMPTDPGIPSIDTSVSFNAPSWDPSVVSINIPDAPAAIDTSGLPVRPSISTAVDIPVAPKLDQPVMESMETITIPAFAFPTLPVFNETAPAFTDAAPNPMINWVEPTYASETLTEVQDVIRRMMAGRTGLPTEVEQAMFDRARAREDITGDKAVAEAFDTFANKGFTMPPGALAVAVAAARDQNQLQSNSLQREVMIKVADIAQENLRFGVQQSVAIEQLLANIFNNAAQRAFEMARFTVESQISLFNTKVSLFNALTSAYQTRASVYKIQIDAALATLDAYRIQLEGQKVISEINAQKVATFNAKVQALMSQVEVYKAQMQGAQVQTDVIRTQLEAYRTDVQAFAEKIGAEKVVFDAYRSQIEGETAKVGIVEAEARVFSARTQAAETQANVRIRQIGADIETMQATTSRYVAQVDRSKADLQAKIAKVEAQARVAGLVIQNLSAQNDANRAKSESEIRIGEQQLQTNIAITSATIERYKIAMQKVMQEADLKARSLQAAGQMASTLAGGAMAAQHVQASISSNASDSTNSSTSFNQSAQESWQYQTTSTGS